ncbi:MAG: ATP-binding cassette domain-containing protein, partial [Ignavibacteria bacterium]|nr:ATP-binding cassette domain-containing protein [Ignavibacteria bacterium]
MIEINNLHKSFGANKVLRGVDLSIKEGESLAIIGRSGCGKSVLLKHIVGLLKPDEGFVKVE